VFQDEGGSGRENRRAGRQELHVLYVLLLGLGQF
jgi:hypothetical protein